MTIRARVPRTMAADPSRIDLKVIAGFIEPGSRVLDVGCGDGTLLARLGQEKQVDGRGIELSRANVAACMARGLSVVQGDANKDLEDYPSQSFDYAVLSQTIQAMQDPRRVLDQLLRIGRKAVVSFPNFGHWRVRWHLAAKGRMPVTKNLPYSWFDTPNIHFCTIADFITLCEVLDARVEDALALDRAGHKIGPSKPWRSWNLVGEQAVFLLSRESEKPVP